MEWNDKSPPTWNWENRNLLSGSELRSNSSKRLISASAVSSSKSPVETEDSQPNEQSKSNDLTKAELGLKLGKRTYFEDVCAGNNSMTKNSNTSTTKKIRASQVSSAAAYRCQVEGCNVDLSGAKDYHRKHRVCDAHSKCSKVVVAGQECRFCQQCSRFHGLLEFDHKKRSCRRRLSDHNARRRKPQVETISFNSSTYGSPFYEDRQQVGFVLNKAPFSIMRQNVSSTWNDSSGFSLTHSKGSWINKSVKVERTDEHIQTSNTAISNLIPSLAYDTDKLVNFKGPTHETLGEGTEAASVSASNLDRSALSLLSTESWVSSNLAQSNLPHLISTNHHNNNNSNIEDGYWKYQVTQAQETQCVTTPFEHHNSNSGAQFDAHFFDSNQILSKPNFLF